MHPTTQSPDFHTDWLGLFDLNRHALRALDALLAHAAQAAGHTSLKLQLQEILKVV